MSSKKHSLLKYMAIYVVIEILSGFFFSSRMGDQFNLTAFFFVWAVLSALFGLTLVFGIESRGNLLGLGGNVYSHNAVNFLEAIQGNPVLNKVFHPKMVLILPVLVNLGVYLWLEK